MVHGVTLLQAEVRRRIARQQWKELKVVLVIRIIIIMPVIVIIILVPTFKISYLTVLRFGDRNRIQCVKKFCSSCSYNNNNSLIIRIILILIYLHGRNFTLRKPRLTWSNSRKIDY